MMYSLLSLQADWIFRPADLLKDGAWTAFKHEQTHTHTHTHKERAREGPISHIHLFNLCAQNMHIKAQTHTHTQTGKNTHTEMTHARTCTDANMYTNKRTQEYTHLYIILLPKPLKQPCGN